MARKTDLYAVGSDYNVYFENLTAITPAVPVRIPAGALSGMLGGSLAALATLMILAFWCRLDAFIHKQSFSLQ